MLQTGGRGSRARAHFLGIMTATLDQVTAVENEAGEAGGAFAVFESARASSIITNSIVEAASRQSAKQTVYCLWCRECGAMKETPCEMLSASCGAVRVPAAINLSDTPWFSSSCRQAKWGCGLDSGKGICAVFSRRLWSQATAEIFDLALCLY